MDFRNKKAYLKDAVNTWRNNFDWRKHEAKLNEAGSFKYKTKSGLELHYLQKSNSKNAIPLSYPWMARKCSGIFKIIPSCQLAKMELNLMLFVRQYQDMVFLINHLN